MDFLLGGNVGPSTSKSPPIEKPRRKHEPGGGSGGATAAVAAPPPSRQSIERSQQSNPQRKDVVRHQDRVYERLGKVY